MIFVDTSAWLAVSDSRDRNHAAAMGFYKELTRGRFGRLVTSDYVLDETYTLVRKRAGPGAVERFSHGLDESPSVQSIWITPEQFRTAKAMFLEQGNRGWSSTDCTSFVAMRELGIVVAFAFDSDFRTAGLETRPA